MGSNLACQPLILGGMFLIFSLIFFFGGRALEDAEKFPDLRALLILCGLSGRSLNIYVIVEGRNEHLRPYRYNPSGFGHQSKQDADAVAYFGFNQDGKHFFADLVPIQDKDEVGRNLQEPVQMDNVEGVIEKESGRASSPPCAIPPVLEGQQRMQGSGGSSDSAPDEEIAELLKRGTRADTYQYPTFNLDDWEINDRGLFTAPGKWMSKEEFERVRPTFPQFTERFVFHRSKVGKKERMGHHGYGNLPICEDAHATSPNMISVFDGVGQGQYWSGKLARELARRSLEKSKMYSTTCDNEGGPGKNRSAEIVLEALSEAQKYVTRSDPNIFKGIPPGEASVNSPFMRLLPKNGTSTAVVLSLVRSTMHSFVYGDSQWALLRQSPEGNYKCEKISEPVYHPPHDMCVKPDPSCHCKVCQPLQIPKQLQANCNRKLDDNEISRSIDCCDVKEGDIIVAASDGLWDNFPFLCRCAPGNLPCACLNRKLEAVATETATHATSRPFVVEFGSKLAELAKAQMTVLSVPEGGGGGARGRRGKPDDLTIVVSKISMSSDPNRQDCENAMSEHSCYPACKEKVESDQGCASFVVASYPRVRRSNSRL